MTSQPSALLERRLHRLRLFNAGMGTLHLAQGVVILLLSTSFTLPVTATFMEGPPGQEPPELRTLFDLRIAWGVAAFVFLSAAAHFLLVLPGINGWYNRQLQRNRNYARWIEYSLSSSIMIVLIAMLTGISEVTALGALFAANAAMILFGLLMEHYEEPGRPNWTAFAFGSAVGIVPWLLIALYLIGPGEEATPPAFVYGIFFSLFLFFNVFALNMVLQYRRAGPWRHYLFGESVYIVLSLTAKSLLAWQVFFPTLV
ncbi:MAG: heliorhodopsin HeR [Dehalococcoidia bacterium]